MKPATCRVSVIALLSLVLVACGSEPEMPPHLPFATPGASLTVEPVGTACTAAGLYRASVAWQVEDALVEQLEVQVGTTERTVFARSDERSGSAETGDWVRAETVFHLLNRNGDRLLASTQAGPGDCQPAAPDEGDHGS
ncbi:hypothetical protein [Lysobacter sp. D1-1-M9]|uniref:hypothetical protein n=1 Tax=Novilysobacter longmucuonensis TaxID=3098603 RepID=UPI002FCA1F6E